MEVAILANVLVGVEGFGAELELVVRDRTGSLRRGLAAPCWACIPLPEGAELVVRHAKTEPERPRLEDAESP